VVQPTTQGAMGFDLGMSHRFLVTAGSRSLGSWTKVAGLAVKWDLAEHRVGDSDQYYKYAAIPKFTPLKMSRAAEATGTVAVQQWLEEVKASGGVPEAGAVSILTSSGEKVATWSLQEMFPISWSISDFDAGSAAKVAVETLEIVYSGFIAPSARYGR
jgi:phage tail-like protein